LELTSSPEYKEYKLNRKPYDLQQEKISLEELALEENIKLSFWKILFNSKKKNFNKHLHQRLKEQQKLNLYLSLNEDLKELPHQSLKDSIDYKKKKTEGFLNYEKEWRPTLNTLPAIRDNAKTVKNFVGVLRMVKKNIIGN